MLAPQFAVERCSEIVIGIVSAIVADLLFSPRSIKKEIDLELDNLLIDQYRLMQLCVAHGEKEEVDKPGARWCVAPRAGRDAQQPDYGILALGKGESAPEGDQYPLSNAYYSGLRNLFDPESRPEMVTDDYRELFAEPVETVQDVTAAEAYAPLSDLEGEHNTPVTIYSWVGAATRYLLLKRGVVGNTKISRLKRKCCRRSGGKGESAERHHAMVNFWHLHLLYPRDAVLAVDRLDLRQRGDGDDCRGYALAMRLPNPRMVAIDFLYGTLAALPLGALFFLVIMPATQQSMLLLCISLAAMAFFIGIEVQKRRLGSLGALASTINILVLDNPMQFQFSQFLDSALGQIVGCFLALMVILLVRDNSRAEPVGCC
jgi:p-hydroxybenzoic acid efflux pump subunit AaeB